MVVKLQIYYEVLRKIYYILTKNQKRRSIVCFTAILVSSLFELLGVTIIVPFISAVMNPRTLLQNEYTSFFLHIFDMEELDPSMLLLIIGGVLIFIYIAKNVGLIGSRYIQNVYQTSLQKDISTAMMKSYLSHSYEYFVNINSVEIIRGIDSDVSGFIVVTNMIFSSFAEVLTLLLILGFVLTMDFFTSIGLVGIALLCVIIIAFGFKNLIAKTGNQYREALLARSKCAHQTVNGIKEIFVMQRKKFFLDSYEKVCEQYTATIRAYTLISSLPERIIETLVVCGIVLVVCVRIIQGYAATDYISQLAAIAVACFRLLPSLNKLTTGVSEIIYNKPCLDSVYNNITEARDFAHNFVSESIEASGQKGHALTFEKELKIDDVTWRYTNGTKNILEHVSLSVKRGESVALIGESGAGKSTLADIIIGLLHPQVGEVKIDGKPISYNYIQWSQMIGYVPQNIYLLDDTVRNNVAFGVPKEEIRDEVVWNALKQARLDVYIRNLPSGLDTIIGERGTKFSGGQCQRIAIARTMYYDPEILILDEATSALDDETEKAVMESIDSLQGKKTLIIIAHRLSTIAKCNKIYEVVDSGIVEREKSDIIRK